MRKVRKSGRRKQQRKAANESITLELLLSRVTPENLHKEIDWGKPVGREFPFTGPAR